MPVCAVEKARLFLRESPNAFAMMATLNFRRIPIRFYNTCPKTSPSAVTFFSRLIPVGELQSPACLKTLGPSLDCINLGFSNPGETNNAPFLNAGNLPANGTETLSNTGGSITSPISGDTLA